MNGNLSITDRIKKTSKFFIVLLKFARILCCIGMGLLIGAAIFYALFGNVDLLVLGGKTVVRSPYPMENLMGLSSENVYGVFGAGIAGLVLLQLLFRQARQIFEDMATDHSPFERKQVKRIKTISILFFIISTMGFGGDGVSFSFTLNLMGIVGALMLWCMALIFEYGCELQKESDETL